MKRLLLLLLLAVSASSGLAEDATLPKNTIMKADKSLVSLKAGTVVQIIKRDAKFITVKVGDKTGIIPVDSLVPPPAEKPAPIVALPSTPAPALKTVAPAPAPKAVSMYGKAVEKSKDAIDQHTKAAVDPVNEVLDAK
jgi:hypothetical protein